MFLHLCAQRDVTKQWLVRKQRTQCVGKGLSMQTKNTAVSLLDTIKRIILFFQMPSATYLTVVSP